MTAEVLHRIKEAVCGGVDEIFTETIEKSGGWYLCLSNLPFGKSGPAIQHVMRDAWMASLCQMKNEITQSIVMTIDNIIDVEKENADDQ
jgi:hypothetical protein